MCWVTAAAWPCRCRCCKLVACNHHQSRYVVTLCEIVSILVHNYNNICRWLWVMSRNQRIFTLLSHWRNLAHLLEAEAIARTAVNNKPFLPQLVHALCSVIWKELKSLCSDKHGSILRLKSKPALENFTWKMVWLELEQNAPTFLALFAGLLLGLGGIPV